MKDIAREAGVAQGLLHYYFDTRDRLFGEVVVRLLDEHLERLRRDLASAGREKQRELGLGILRRKVLGEKRAWRLLFEVIANASREGYERSLSERFAQRRGLVAQMIGGPDAQAKALAVDALMLGLAAERLAGVSDRDVDAALRAFLESSA